MREKVKRASTFCVLATGLVALGLGLSSAAAPAHAAPSRVDAEAQRGAQANLAAIGRQKFNRACGRCHPGGGEDVGPAITNKNWDQARMTRQIRQGSGRMRPIAPSRLPDADLPALMAYMRTIHAVR